MRKLIVLGAAALTLALGVAQASAAGNSGPTAPNIYSPSWQTQGASASAYVPGR